MSDVERLLLDFMGETKRVVGLEIVARALGPVVFRVVYADDYSTREWEYQGDSKIAGIRLCRFVGEDPTDIASLKIEGEAGQILRYEVTKLLTKSPNPEALKI